MNGARPYVPPRSGNTKQLIKHLKVSSLSWLIEELARQCPEFASYQLLKKQNWVTDRMYQKTGPFKSQLPLMKSRHRNHDITIDRQNTAYADMSAKDIYIRAAKCIERILTTSRDGLSATAKKRQQKDYPTWPDGHNRRRDSKTKWDLVHKLVADTLLNASGQAQLQAQQQIQQQIQPQVPQQPLQQAPRVQQGVAQQYQHQVQQPPLQQDPQVQQGVAQQYQHQAQQPHELQVQRPPESPDADGNYPDLAVEIQLVNLERNKPPGPGEEFWSLTWSDCHNFQAMEAFIRDVYNSDKLQTNISFVAVPRNKDAWHKLDRISHEDQLQTYARVAIYEQRSLQIAVFHYGLELSDADSDTEV
ncbi:hypothetical protein KC332_g5421 [Hortaea werneckii]|nr:hypothetical protein KC358_g5527 [Hortaea werneckii]KAI6845394.1 hypothetical protein KC350_g4475 [Hortaea werneckii]KAI6937283.1 hypothetical protein KC348_g5776 [Hortaea werneckii]KAI6937744.1 hypothetical protein KC341_g5369 [Hortaea werneckii]KAI6973321.1 hypothetical protein KC321_g5737 [Hortaea werneckii]